VLFSSISSPILPVTDRYVGISEIEVVKGQDDLLANLTTYEIVAENFSVSPKTVQRAAEFVTVLDEIKEKTNMRSKW